MTRTSEKLLLESAYHMAEDIAKVGIWELDVQTEEVTWTKGVYAIHELPDGFDQSLFSAKEFYPGEAHARITHVIERAITDNMSYDEVLPLVTAKGNQRWIRTQGKPIIENGRVVKLIGVIRDITKEEEQRLALERNSRLYKTVFNISLIGKAILNPQGKLLECNEALCDFLGYSERELLEMTFPEFTHPEDIDKDVDLFNKLVTGEIDDYSIEKRYIHKSGVIVWGDLTVTLERDDLGEITVIHGAVSNITNQKRLEFDLQERMKEIRCLYEVSRKTSGADSFDELLSGVPQLIPPGFLIPEQLRCRITWGNAIWGNSRKNEPNPTLSVQKLILGKDLEISCWYDQPDSGEVVFLEEETDLLNAVFNLVLTGLERISSDLKIKDYQDKLESAVNKLRDSNKELQDFAYVASHDLQEPLRMVSSFTQLLQERLIDDLTEEQRMYMKYVVDGSNRMQKMISDLLQFSRVNTSTDPFEPVDLNEILNATLMIMNRKIEEVGGAVEFQRLPTIEGVPSMIHRVFLNLLDNALKYRSERNLKVKIWSEEKSSSWEIHFSDNGIGIAPEMIKKIFVIFQRLHKNADIEGSGLGLAITQRIMHKHKGAIKVCSKPGKGSDFIISFPKIA